MIKTIKDFRALKQLFMESILDMDAVDLAYYIMRGASNTDRIYINEALSIAAKEYRDEVAYYTSNPHLFDTDPALKERFSEPSLLEAKIQ